MLTPAELAVVLEPDNDLAFASVAIWELQIKWERRFASGERKGAANPDDVLTYLRDLEMPAIDLTPELAAARLRDPVVHKDPFDALLLTIAQQTGRKLFTRDGKLRGHPLAFHAG